MLFFNIVSLYFNTLFKWYINLTIDGTIYRSQHFPFGAAFVCQAGNFWTLLLSIMCFYSTGLFLIKFVSHIILWIFTYTNFLFSVIWTFLNGLTCLRLPVLNISGSPSHNNRCYLPCLLRHNMICERDITKEELGVIQD